MGWGMMLKGGSWGKAVLSFVREEQNLTYKTEKSYNNIPYTLYFSKFTTQFYTKRTSTLNFQTKQPPNVNMRLEYRSLLYIDMVKHIETFYVPLSVVPIYLYQRNSTGISFMFYNILWYFPCTQRYQSHVDYFYTLLRNTYIYFDPCAYLRQGQRCIYIINVCEVGIGPMRPAPPFTHV